MCYNIYKVFIYLIYRPQKETLITFEYISCANTRSTIEFNDYIAAYPRAGSLHYAIYLGVLFHIPTPRKNFKNLLGRGAFLKGKPVNLSLRVPITSVFCHSHYNSVLCSFLSHFKKRPLYHCQLSVMAPL